MHLIRAVRPTLAMKLAFVVALLAGLAGSAAAQSQSDVSLDELRAAPVPKQQSDLNTQELASAHRERAESMQQKTDGLWQSWLVSICKGCTPDQRRPAEINAAAEALKPKVVSSFTDKPHGSTADPAGQSARPPRPASLTGDLSSENVRQIRMMPGR